MEIPELEKLNNSISVLNRTKESLGASACPDSLGHLLDKALATLTYSSKFNKALAKQIAVRKAELDKLLPNNVFVIVRASTPDPEVLCGNNHQDFCVQDSSEPPILEDFLLPLNNYLDCVLNQTPEQPPQVPPRHPLPSYSTPGVITATNISAPREPWTPPRNSPCPEQFSSIDNKSQGHLLEILTSPESAPLLSTLFTNIELKNSKMEEAREVCEGKIRKYNRLLRRFDPDELDSVTVEHNRLVMTAEVSNALDELVESIETMSIDHGQVLGRAEVTAWKDRITLGETEFQQFVDKVSAKIGDQSQLRPSVSNSQLNVSSIRQPRVVGQQQYQGSMSMSQLESRECKAAIADIEVDATIVSSLGKELAEEINKNKHAD